MQYHPEKSPPEFLRGGAKCGRALIGGTYLKPLLHLYRFHWFAHMGNGAKEQLAELRVGHT